jgi:hypothetical protein
MEESRCSETDLVISSEPHAPCFTICSYVSGVFVGPAVVGREQTHGSLQYQRIGSRPCDVGNMGGHMAHEDMRVWTIEYSYLDRRRIVRCLRDRCTTLKLRGYARQRVPPTLEYGRDRFLSTSHTHIHACRMHGALVGARCSWDLVSELTWSLVVYIVGVSSASRPTCGRMAKFVTEAMNDLVRKPPPFMLACGLESIRALGHNRSDDLAHTRRYEASPPELDSPTDGVA